MGEIGTQTPMHSKSQYDRYINYGWERETSSEGGRQRSIANGKNAHMNSNGACGTAVNDYSGFAAIACIAGI